MIGMTANMLACKNFIRKHVAMKGRRPSFGEIQIGVGAKSRTTAQRLVQQLEWRGHLRRVRGSFELIEECGAPQVTQPKAAFPQVPAIPLGAGT